MEPTPVTGLGHYVATGLSTDMVQNSENWILFFFSQTNTPLTYGSSYFVLKTWASAL